MNIIGIGRDCVGCYNCENVCGQKAIRMGQDKEGFFYPQINVSKCNDCGACYRHCPQTNDLRHKDTSKECYNAISKLRKFYKRSASGGVFVTLAWHFLRQYENGVICGCGFDGGRVHHILVHSEDELFRVQGSKYVQSQLDNVFVEIRQILRDGGHVLFGGTPCQVAALRAFLNQREEERLLTLDLICHGVPSPKFLERDLSLYVPQLSNIKDVQFRSKHPFFRSKSNFCLSLTTDSSYFSRKPTSALNQDPYFSLFSKGWTLRWSCYQCHYANLRRVGDVTIGDCDSWSCYPHFHPNEATSAVFINTLKGEGIWNMAKDLFDFIDLDLEKEAKVNRQLTHPFACPIERETIYEELEKLSIQEIRKYYAKPKTLRSKAGKILNTFFPYCISKKITKIVCGYDSKRIE